MIVVASSTKEGFARKILTFGTCNVSITFPNKGPNYVFLGQPVLKDKLKEKKVSEIVEKMKWPVNIEKRRTVDIVSDDCG